MKLDAGDKPTIKVGVEWYFLFFYYHNFKALCPSFNFKYQIEQQ